MTRLFLLAACVLSAGLFADQSVQLQPGSNITLDKLSDTTRVSCAGTSDSLPCLCNIQINPGGNWYVSLTHVPSGKMLGTWFAGYGGDSSSDAFKTAKRNCQDALSQESACKK